MSCLGILRRKENRAATEADMLYLNPHEFADPTAKLINNLEHQLVAVIVNAVEKTLQLING
jgi:predicted metal-dependent peptidase